jgi:hypothetical protein
MLSPADLVNGDAPLPAVGHHAVPPITRMVAASARTAAGGPAKMISPRSIT